MLHAWLDIGTTDDDMNGCLRENWASSYFTSHHLSINLRLWRKKYIMFMFKKKIQNDQVSLQVTGATFFSRMVFQCSVSIIFQKKRRTRGSPPFPLLIVLYYGCNNNGKNNSQVLYRANSWTIFFEMSSIMWVHPFYDLNVRTNDNDFNIM